jgi:uncharacterized membrane protein YoaK (UPF0700 family)
MKKLFLLILFIVPAMYAAWPIMTPEQKEMRQIQEHIAAINHKFSVMGGYRSAARTGAIARYLQDLGTEVSYKIYQEMKATGELR